MSKFHIKSSYRRRLPVIPEDVEIGAVDVTEESYPSHCFKFSKLEDPNDLDKLLRLSPPRNRNDNRIRMNTDIPQLVNWHLDTYPQDLQEALTWAH